MKKIIFLFLLALNVSLVANAQNRSISGTVTDSETSEPVTGAIVMAVGQSNAYASTDANGKFQMSINNKATELTVQFLGYKDATVAVTNASVYNIALETDAIALSEVVVTALGVSRDKKTIGYSIQEVGGDDLSITKPTNIVNALQGKVAGVQISSGGSALGSSSKISIRGNGGFSGNSPLWVVDGVPISNATSSRGAGTAVDYGSALSDLDSNNIESMTVLKGASASALYGSRALNGVILVTTKTGKGKDKGIGVEFNSSLTLQAPSYYQNFQDQYGQGLNGDEYSYNNNTNASGVAYKDIYSTHNEYASEISYKYIDQSNGINKGAASWGAPLDEGFLMDQWSTGPSSAWVSNPDRVKNYFDTGYDLENNISVTSNGDNASARFSYTNLTSKGIVPNTDQTQNTISVNTTIKPAKWLELRADINYLIKNSDNLQSNGYNYADPYAWAGVNYDVAYLRSLYEDQGLNENQSYQSNNFFWTQDNITNSFRRERVYGNLSATATLTDWLNVVFRYGLDSYEQRTENKTPAESWANIKTGKGGQFGRTTYDYSEKNSDLFFNYDKTFGDFRIDGLVGGNYRNLNTINEYMYAADLTVPNLFTMANCNGNPTATNSMSELMSFSAFGSLNVSYKDFLFIGLTGRNDWSSTLPKGNNSYFYPSFNLGVSLTDAFDIHSNTLNYAKPRFNIAKVGSATSAYQLAETYVTGTYDTTTIFYPDDTSAPINLQPQMATSWEIGVDLRMFDNRFTFDFTYYERYTKNMILSIPVSQSTGYGSLMINAGEIENKGFEVMAGYEILRNKNGWFWDVNVNWATNTNMVNELYPGVSQYQISSGYGSCTIVAEEGKEWGQIQGAGYVRTDDGEIINGTDGLPLTSSDTKLLGKVTPDWTGGISTSVNYKGFQLNATVDMSFGADFISTTMWHSYPTGSYWNTVEGGVRENGVVGEGVVAQTDTDGNTTYVPNTTRVSAQSYFNGGWVWSNREYSILDADYIKLREIALSYQFKFKSDFVIKGLNLSLTCRNAAYIYRDKQVADLGLDPEAQFGGSEAGMGVENFNLPGTRSYGFKLGIKF